ncbi:MAG: aspartate aminotransferase family protein [Myxococcota bacterium]
MSDAFEKIVEREQSVFAPGVRRWPLALVRGEGSRVWDIDGREYIDLTAGWGVTVIGHCHAEVADALADQARTLIQTTNVVYTREQLDLAERLERITPANIRRAFFVSSGAEANEGALKLAHRATGRARFVATRGSFHGRTLGAMGVLGQEKYRKRWSALIHEARFVPYGDLASARAALDRDVAAFIVEPVQGEGGVHVPPDDYLPGLADACHAVGALLILDEIQTGIGRTGRWLAADYSGVQPDILTLGKGLGGGVPIAAFLATDGVMATIEPGDHGGTYAGNPLCARAACTVLDVIERESLVARADRLGTRIRDRLTALADRHPGRIEQVRGRGLLIGLVLRDPSFAAEVHPSTRERGVLVNLSAERVLRLFPALNIPESDLDEALEVLEEVIAEA